jgi:acetyl-CoA acetyltransferase
LQYGDYRGNPNGGAIALCTMCIGVGQGIAVVLERV